MHSAQKLKNPMTHEEPFNKNKTGKVGIDLQSSQPLYAQKQHEHPHKIVVSSLLTKSMSHCLTFILSFERGIQMCLMKHLRGARNKVF